MKQTYVLKQIDKLNELELTIDEKNKALNRLVNQITIWDDPDFLKRNRSPEDKEARKEAGLDDDVEYFNGAESTDFSKENWERFKKGLPLKMPKIFLPKRLDGRNSIEVYGRSIYIVKKNVNMTPVSMFCAYDAKTGIQLCQAWRKRDIETFLIENLQDKLHIIEKDE